MRREAAQGGCWQALNPQAALISLCSPSQEVPLHIPALFKETQGLGNPQGAWTPTAESPPPLPQGELCGAGGYAAVALAFVFRTPASLRRAAGVVWELLLVASREGQCGPTV